MKRMTRAMVALAAGATAAVLALPSAANANPANEWGPYYSHNDLARVKGTIDITWNQHQTINRVDVTGQLWDDDNRYYKHGGKCAYVKFQVSNLFSHHFYTVKKYKHCGYGTAKHFAFGKKGVSSLRFKVCQIHHKSGKLSSCSDWNYLYTVESE
ncbi:hypothetical protein Aph01nite_20380 [Acrocarpospora phusangensis]|uniref:Secreted protein n=1 Tax=Acrocarpospora phusangensis TaxID=1070424 RepID=A0A919QAB1_9ACTN|nr:hypothetical protein [Acrocarpospora phusangensis]GIH23728.1 hypothetical protein Aph01nite_20380 [Acrocarpospora phusangensis]